MDEALHPHMSPTIAAAYWPGNSGCDYVDVSSAYNSTPACVLPAHHTEAVASTLYLDVYTAPLVRKSWLVLWAVTVSDLEQEPYVSYAVFDEAFPWSGLVSESLELSSDALYRPLFNQCGNCPPSGSATQLSAEEQSTSSATQPTNLLEVSGEDDPPFPPTGETQASLPRGSRTISSFRRRQPRVLGGYTCRLDSWCGKKFDRASDLRKHQKRVHVDDSDKPFACEECPRRFAERRDLRRHQAVHFHKQTFPATDCPSATVGLTMPVTPVSQQVEFESNSSDSASVFENNTATSSHDHGF